MPYLIRKNPSLAGEVRRVLCEQLDGAIDDLEQWRTNPHRRIHWARQKSKRIRAALRLIRPSAEYVYQVENRVISDLAKRLSIVRDAEAMIEGLDTLQDDPASRLPPATYRVLRRSLAERRQAIAAEQTDLEPRITDVLRGLRKTRRRLAHVPLGSVTRKRLKKGLHRTAARGVEAFRAARRSGQAEDFHDWRKRAKYLYNQSRLMGELMPRWTHAHRGTLRELSELLGHGNDLVILDQVLARQPDELGIDTNIQLLRRAIRERLGALRERAIVLGTTIYEDRRSEASTVVPFPGRGTGTA